MTQAITQVTIEPTEEATSPNGFSHPMMAETRPDPIPMDPSRISWCWFMSGQGFAD